MVRVALVPSHCMLDSFVSCKIDCVCRACILGLVTLASAKGSDLFLPAPRATLEIPRHKDPKPSALEMVESAFDRPV